MINIKFLLATLLIFTISTSYASESIERLKIARDKNDIAIQSQLIKSDSNSQSILLYIQDSKCRSSAKQFFKQTKSLNNTIARLYVEKIGEADFQKKHGRCSDAFLSNSSIDQRITDYHQVLASLRSSADWWDKKLYIIGEAEGGLIAGLIAANTPETSKLAIISFGGGLTMAEAWIASVTKSMQAEGQSSADIDKMQKNASKFFSEKVAKSDSKTALSKNVTFKWWASVVNVRLSDTLAKVDFPIFMAHGTDDSKIPVESAQKVSDLFSTLGKDNLVYNEYTGTIKKDSVCHTSSATKSVFTDAINWLVIN